VEPNLYDMLEVADSDSSPSDTILITRTEIAVAEMTCSSQLGTHSKLSKTPSSDLLMTG
jgi:hypothetical protein